jgi:hypothetical protein
MKPTVKAILGRFNGDALKAFAYCDTIAQTYPELHPEYSALAKAVWDDASGKTEAAHVAENYTLTGLAEGGILEE